MEHLEEQTETERKERADGKEQREGQRTGSREKDRRQGAERRTDGKEQGAVKCNFEFISL